MDRDAAQDLDVEVPLADRPLGRLAHQGEGLDQQAVQRIPLLGAKLERMGLALQLGVAERLQLGLQRVDPRDQKGILAEPPGVGRAAQLRNAIQPHEAEAVGHGALAPVIPSPFIPQPVPAACSREITPHFQ